MRGFVLAVLTVFPLAAQFSGLTTTGDGAEAWFSTSLPRKGTEEARQERIYKIGARGLELFAEREAVWPEAPVPVPRGGIRLSNYYRLTGLEASRDASVIALIGRRDCFGNAMCATVNPFETTVQASKGELRLEGGGRLSGNGRFVFLYTGVALEPWRPTVVDIITGEKFAGQSQGVADQGATGRVVADDGTAVFTAGRSYLFITKGGRVEELLRASLGLELTAAEQPVIDAAARVVLYAARPRNSEARVIRIFRLPERRDALFIGGNGDSYAPAISADGRRVMFISTAQFGTSDPPGLPQLYVVNIDGTGFRRASDDAGGVLDAVMSDDGRVAWYFSGSGRLMRLDLETGRAEEKIGRTILLGAPLHLVPGSATTLTGVGLDDAKSLTVDGVPAPLLAVNTTSITFQAPWETPANALVDLELEALPDSPFESTLKTSRASERAFPALLPLAVHEKWDAVVTSGNPARPGEIVHFYGTGFGAVEPAARTGVPAPADPPARTVTPVTCFTWGTDNQRIDVPVLFSGLAPGLVGYYQLSVRLPASAVPQDLFLKCAGEGDPSDFYGWLPVNYPPAI